MAVSLKHKFQSQVPDEASPEWVRPSNWNAEHDLELASDRLLGRDTAGDGAVEEIEAIAPVAFNGSQGLWLRGTTAQFQASLTDDDFATLTNTVTLTNKTLDDATFTGTVTGPSGTWDSGGLDIAEDSSYAINGTDVIADSEGTATLSNIDALDATTEATVEDALDALPNLETVQGHTFTLTGDFIRSGAHSLTLTTTGATSVTLPTTGVLATFDRLASTANGDGASLIGIEDAGDDFAATTVEGALDELFALGESLGASLTDHVTDTDNPHSVTPAQLSLGIGTDVQAWDDDLDDIAALSPGDGNFIVGDGTDWIAESGATARASLDVYSTSEAEAADPDILKADVADVLEVGYATTVHNAGTQSSGTYTPDEADGNFQRAVNGGAHTLAPPTNDCNIVIQYTNDGSAGAITTSGFTIVTGSSFTTDDGDDFLAYVTKINGFSHLNVVALQ